MLSMLSRSIKRITTFNHTSNYLERPCQLPWVLFDSLGCKTHIYRVWGGGGVRSRVRVRVRVLFVHKSYCIYYLCLLTLIFVGFNYVLFLFLTIINLTQTRFHISTFDNYFSSLKMSNVVHGHLNHFTLGNLQKHSDHSYYNVLSF